MIAQKLEDKYYTFDEYLLLEEQASERHEYHAGEIIQMSGGTFNHNAIANRIATTINNELDKSGKDCTTTNSDMKVFIESVNHAVYPDNLVLCGDPEFYNGQTSVITNPMLVIEVLSKSTKSYDRGLKFEKYRTLPSFKEYMLVWQTVPKVQTWYKEEENLWRISSAFGLESKIPLFSIECEIVLSEIYKRIKGLETKDDWKAY